MGNVSSGKRLYNINKSFFRGWSPQMAHILGFTCADGNLHNKTLSWELSDKFDSNFDLLARFNNAMNSDYPILKGKFSYRLRISNPSILKDVKKLGIIPNKKKVLSFPNVPKRFVRHFIRGFLDGDGWITTRTRSDKYNEISVGFSNGSRDFMENLINIFKLELGISNFNLRCREKFTKKGDVSKIYQLEFYSNNARKILSFLYDNLSNEDLFLLRKYKKYSEAINVFDGDEKIRKFGRRWANVEEDYASKMDKLFANYLNKKKVIPREIAKEFGVSLSTLYRWLDKSGIRTFEKRGSDKWARRIIFSKRLAKNV